MIHSQQKRTAFPSPLHTPSPSAGVVQVWLEDRLRLHGLRLHEPPDDGLQRMMLQHVLLCQLNARWANVVNVLQECTYSKMPGRGRWGHCLWKF